MSGINRFGFGGVYVLHSDHEAEVARLRAEVPGLSEALTDALACEQDYLREISDLLAETDSLRAEVEAYRKDAERYRWLRNDAMTGTKHDPAVLKDGPTDCCEFMFGDELDAAIDAAMGASE